MLGFVGVRRTAYTTCIEPARLYMNRLLRYMYAHILTQFACHFGDSFKLYLVIFVEIEMRVVERSGYGIAKEHGWVRRCGD
jgi:hypothetical protein